MKKVGADVLNSEAMMVLRATDTLVSRSLTAQKQVAYYDRITQDILHDLELNPHSGAEMLKLTKELKQIRQERRKHKDIVEVCAPIVKWESNNHKVLAQLRTAISESEKVKEEMETRVYHPREREEMKTTPMLRRRV